MGCAGNGMAEDMLVDARRNAAAFRPAKSAVAQDEDPAGRGNGKRKGDAVRSLR